jgi:hypothetical protein
MIAYTCDTADPAKEAANLRWSSEIYPNIVEQHVRLAKRFVEFGVEVPGMEIPTREFRTDIEIFRESNVPLLAEVEELIVRYQKITGGLEVDWEGERKTIPQLQPFLRERDRSVRERAFRSGRRRTSAIGQATTPSTGCLSCVNRSHGTQGSTTTWRMPSGPSTGSTIRRKIARDFTMPWRPPWSRPLRA